MVSASLKSWAENNVDVSYLSAGYQKINAETDLNFSKSKSATILPPKLAPSKIILVFPLEIAKLITFSRSWISALTVRFTNSPSL